MLTHLVKVPLMLRPAAMEDLPALMLLQGNSGGVPQVGPRRPQPLRTCCGRSHKLWHHSLECHAPQLRGWHLISTDHPSIIG